MVTKHDIANKILSYLQHQIQLADLVSWAEDVLYNGNFQAEDDQNIRSALARLGVSDVKTFGLEWNDCENIMASLGYKLEVKAKQVA